MEPNAWIELGKMAIPVLGALILAWLTRRWTDDRQERALRAEQERLDSQLAHQRELADLAELRALLEEAVSTLHRAHLQITSATTSYFKSGGPRVPREPAIRVSKTPIDDLWHLYQRLCLRVDTEDPIAKASVMPWIASMSASRARTTIGRRKALTISSIGWVTRGTQKGYLGARPTR